MNSKYTVYLFGIVLMVGLIAGCYESPESKAAKQAREQAEKAMAIVADYRLDAGYDYAAAKQEVDKAISLANRAAGQADNVFFVSGDLTEAYAEKQRQSISNLADTAAAELSKSLNIARRLSETESQRQTIEMLMASGEQEASSLKGLLNNEQAGIKARLVQTQDTLASLNEQLESYKQAAAVAKQAADSINRKADTMLRDAQLLKGEQRIELERKAYGLLRGDGEDKSFFYYQKLQQSNIDKAGAVEVQIYTYKPLIAKLQGDIDYVSQRIVELDSQDELLDFSEHLASLTSLSQELTDALASQQEVFAVAFDSYKNAVSQQMQLYADAKDNYAKVRTQGLREMAQLKTADCEKAIAMLNADVYRFVGRVAARANAVASVYLENIDTGIGQLADSLRLLSAEYGEAAATAYDVALEEYQNVIDTYSSGEFADTAVRSYMIAIYERLHFDYGTDIASLQEQMLDKVEQIKDISIQNDPQFGNSKIAMLFAGYGIEFKTAEQRLIEEYQSLKVRFAALRDESLTYRRQQLLALLDDLQLLGRPDDGQFYSSYVRDIYTLYQEDWLDIYETQENIDSLSLFSELIAQDTAVDEPADIGGDYIGGGDPNF